MLIAVIMIFVVFSFTGLAVMNVAYLSQTTSMETVTNIKLQYALESEVNQALWHINRGADSLVNIQTDDLTLTWQPENLTLAVEVDRFQMEAEVLLNLTDMHHFDHAIAVSETIEDNGYAPLTEEAHQVRENISFLPEVDLDFFMDNAISVSKKPEQTNSYNGKGKSKGKGSTSSDDIILADGIHVFTGNGITIQDLRLYSGTIVFTGKNIRFRGDNIIKAPQADSTGAMPALIFTHPQQTFEMYSDNEAETIIGAIYCAGEVELHNGNLSGPVIAKSVYLGDDINFLDTEYPLYYQWNDGFGDKNDYDFPKQIKRWKQTKWTRKARIEA